MSGQAGPPWDSDNISLVEIANVLLRWRWLIVGVPLALLLLTAPGLFMAPRQYTATASFMPQRAPSAARSLGTMAGQLGITLPGQAQGESPAFYAELVTSRAILLPVLETAYEVSADGRNASRTLIELYGEDRTGAERREVALRRLRDQVRVSISRTTDIVTISVTAASPRLAEQIVARALELVNQFNLETRQSQASEERRFVEARLGEAREELRAAEDELEQFLERNRAYQSSPQLALVHSRHEREVMRRQQVYTTLAQAYEQARIDEVRNIPVITIIEPPSPPVHPDGRGVVTRSLMAILGGILLAIVLAVVLDFFRAGSVRRDRGFEEFERLRRETLRDLRRPWRLLNRR
jgi:uncharacterized protein involved in exopolysaccharide biosynthesis